MDFARRGNPLSILSVTSSDSTEGYIYIEAFKEIHVKEACEKLHFILNQYTLLPTDQMTSVYQHDKAKSNDIKQHQWIRIKAGGVYKDDIGLVEGVIENKVWVRLVPRIEITKSGDTKNASKRSMFSKVP